MGRDDSTLFISLIENRYFKIESANSELTSARGPGTRLVESVPRGTLFTFYPQHSPIKNYERSIILPEY
jgi:hypothetical protein